VSTRVKGETAGGDPSNGHEGSLLWTLEEISRLVSYSGDPSETLSNVVRLIQQRFATDVCSVYLLEPGRASLVLSATIGLRRESVGQVHIPITEGLVGLVAETRRPLFAQDATSHPRFKYIAEAGEDPYHTFVGVPILDRGILHGVLVVQTIERRTFDEDDIRMIMTAGAQVAPVVSDARLEQRRAVESDIAQRAKRELVETLAGGIAHELNNKLMPVAGFAELLIAEAERVGSPSLQDYGHTIHDSVLEAVRIIRQLLQLSKPDREQSADYIACDLREIVSQALTLVRLRLQEAATQVEVQLPDGPVPIRADASQIKQVFLNLVWNAIDAMDRVPDRHLTIRLQVNASTATLSCIDRGQGIPPDILPRVFDPFFTTKEPSRGTGLGLSVCQAIARQHGGDVRVQSEMGVGTSFHVVLPINAAEALSPQRATAGRLQFNVSPGHRVLVVDDEEPVLRVVSQALEKKLGCLVEKAHNGVEARLALENREFALVLSDIRMPTMNGVEFLEWAAGHRPELLPKVVFMTGDAGQSPLNAAVERAKRPVLRKPFSLETLLTSASKILGEQPAA
jgi:signal transduction histidine kinase/CheY-like chemotaxis protein